MDMERNDKIRNLVFSYLDGLFENIDISENEFGIRGEVGNVLLFSYFPQFHRLFFNRDTINLMYNMFGFDINDKSVGDYVKLYLSKKVKSSLITASLLPTL